MTQLPALTDDTRMASFIINPEDNAITMANPKNALQHQDLLNIATFCLLVLEDLTEHNTSKLMLALRTQIDEVKKAKKVDKEVMN